ncbi:helix-turn-helix domain-containing protein [Sinomonas sp. JGH33]|uniref:Helix-turn-helix domain-containing protein n=1 Tax=Sinomonas terricola TaxID=3110330 RepID=A0ABU5T841_9MICC|nr:helix-turn-helix domain-containing protein [Sinomonas sp. JGH33]MEA5455844.1 helix-turn-helix domain-containing protein [Sinomonas sp. JGH33]
MGSVNVDDILEDLPAGLGRLISRPQPTDAPVAHALILDSEDSERDVAGALVCLMGVRGREALPMVRRLAVSRPVAVALKGTPGEAQEIEELLRPAGVGLFLIDPTAGWDTVLSMVNGRIQNTDYHSDVLALIEEDLFAIAQTTAKLTSSHVVIEDAANKVLAYSTVSNDIDELRRASILARRGPRKYETLLKDLGAYRELHRTRGVVRVPERPEDGLKERAAIAIFAGERVLGYIWLQETGSGFAPSVDDLLVGAARRASAELVRHRNEQSVHLREDRIARLLSTPDEAAASAQFAQIDPERPACLVLVGLSPEALRAADADLKRGELANLAAIHAAAFKASAVVGQFGGETAIVVPELRSGDAAAALRVLAESIIKDARRIGVGIHVAIGEIAPSLFALRTTAGETAAVLRCLRRKGQLAVGTLDDFEAEVTLDEASRAFESSPFRHRALTRLCLEDEELAQTLVDYFAAGLDVSECGRRMGLHKNTVYYRVAKASRLTDLDFGYPAHVAIAVLHLELWKAKRLATAAGT